MLFLTTKPSPLLTHPLPQVLDNLKAHLSTALPNLSPSPTLSLYPDGHLWVSDGVTATWLGYQDSTLCAPSGWTPEVGRQEIVFVVGVKGSLEVKVEQLIGNVARLQKKEEGEFTVSLVIVDFNSDNSISQLVEKMAVSR